VSVTRSGWPPVNSKGLSVSQDIASGALTPVTDHGGSVMAGGITVHAIFWNGGNPNAFQGRPAGAPADYESLINRFFADAATDSGAAGNTCTTAACNVFTVLPQYAQETGVSMGRRRRA
jgi:hypothetical protein